MVWVHDLGDEGPGGGIVFYTDFNGYYLEAAPSDLVPDGASAGFSSVLNCLAGTPEWTGPFTSYSGIAPAGVETIGDGKSNTRLFIDNYPETDNARQNAPQAADNYVSANGIDDWFLPSIGELNELFAYTFPTGPSGTNNNASINVNIIGTDVRSSYHSSTQASSTSAMFYQTMSTGPTNTLGKINTGRSVRPVREFRAGSYPLP